MTIEVSTTNSKIRVHVGRKPKLCLKSGNYEFLSSKVYALVGKSTGNGYALSCLLSGLANLGHNQIKIDGNLLNLSELRRKSCFIGVGQRNLFWRNMTVKQQIISSLNESKNSQSFESIVDKFGLTPERVDRKLAYTGNERWRASIAIAYAG